MKNILILIFILDRLNLNKSLLLDNNKELKIIKTCQDNIFKTYKIEGLDTAIESNFVSQMCPNIKYSCCTKKDVELSLKDWNENIRLRLESHFEYYLKLIKEILKIKNTIYEILKKETFDKNKENCTALRNDYEFIEKKIDSTEIIKFYSIGFDTLAYLRKGIICSVCNHDNHNFIKFNELDNDKKYLGKIIISEGFCVEYMKLLSDYFKFKFNIIVPYLLILNTLNNCVNDEDNKFQYSFHDMNLKNFDSCWNTKEINLLSSDCKLFCQNFDFNKFTDLIEGNLIFLNNLIIKIKQLKVLKNLEIISNMTTLDKTNQIYDNKNILYNLSNYEVEVRYEGINLIKDSKDTGFELTMNSNNINEIEKISKNINNHIKIKENIIKAKKKIEKEEEKTINENIYTINIKNLLKQIKLSKYKEIEVPNEEFLNNLKKFVEENENKYFLGKNN